ncbi:iron-sulfur cluster repair di-iron protein [Metabacillus endolithicus]|uniref:Iron-sulfur cluster repair di-iron protein n=1 Tax=Metabacillus endolithicus TaxID=1535204 RepID=A0ABW5C1T4_9BACI|nr:iron-sulfur cluster repair di-iron protein [Metabacillus endolithicus]UPG66033.1 iron-sulfur cluster repair di-iron protein [Metabacillus endolithicus]
MFTQTMLVRDIVNQFPESSDLFKKFRIDFCCGGKRPLHEAVLERNVDIEVVMQQLQKLYQSVHERNEMTLNWNETTVSDLIQHIKTKHHIYLANELPQLTPYVTKVMRVHGPDQPHLLQIHKLFNELKTELEQHTVKEEAIVFPLIEKLAKETNEEERENIKAQIIELENEHDHAGNLIKAIRKMTDDFTPPEHACGTYRLVYQRLEALESDLFEHIHLENNILFQKVM